jgi:hypothetical protein
MPVAEIPHWIEWRVQQARVRRREVQPSARPEDAMSFPQCGQLAALGQMLNNIEEADGVEILIFKGKLERRP